MNKSALTLILPAYAALVNSTLNQIDTPYFLSRLLERAVFTARPQCLLKRLYTLLYPSYKNETDLPMAKLRDPKASLCADPCYIHADQGRLLMFYQDIELDSNEADELIHHLQPLFACHDMRLTQYRTNAWMINSDMTEFPDFSAITELEQQSVFNALPQGWNARWWINLWNELQMSLFDHPVNVQRQASGKLPVNSLWFWGRGEQPTEHTNWDRIWAADELPGQLSQQEVAPFSEFSVTEPSGKQLCCLPQFDLSQGWQSKLAELDRQLFQPVWQQLRSGRLQQLTLVIPQWGDYRLTLLRSWKWW